MDFRNTLLSYLKQSGLDRELQKENEQKRFKFTNFSSLHQPYLEDFMNEMTILRSLNQNKYRLKLLHRSESQCKTLNTEQSFRQPSLKVDLGLQEVKSIHVGKYQKLEAVIDVGKLKMFQGLLEVHVESSLKEV